MAALSRRYIKIIFQFIIPLIISVGLCYILYSGMDWAEVEAGLRSCRWEWIGAWAAVNVLVMWFRAIRWRIQLRVIDVNPPKRVMFWAILGTYAVNLVFPRLGEVWRSGYVAKRQQAPFTSVFGSMVADRLSDTASVILITMFTVVVARGPMHRFITETGFGDKLQSIITSPWALAFLAVIIAALLVLALFPKVNLIARIRSLLRNVWTGFVSIFHMHHAGLWLLLTTGIWAGYFVSTWCSFLAFDATATLLATDGIVAALVTFVFGSWAMAVPSNGGIGPWQMAVILALSGIYGMAQGPALAYATIVLATQTLLFILLGLYAFISISLDRR